MFSQEMCLICTADLRIVFPDPANSMVINVADLAVLNECPTHLFQIPKEDHLGSHATACIFHGSGSMCRFDGNALTWQPQGSRKGKGRRAIQKAPYACFLLPEIGKRVSKGIESFFAHHLSTLYERAPVSRCHDELLAYPSECRL